MKSKITSLYVLSVLTLSVAACQLPPKLEDAQYWQRKSATSSLYLRGPKAQQTLHQDIATCVTEIDELERLEPLREAMPADTKNGKVIDPNSARGKLAKWDSPKRDGFLHSEHYNYVDFEGCMNHKGWERVENLPYDQATKSRSEYLETVHGYRYKSNHPEMKSGNSSNAFAKND